MSVAIAWLTGMAASVSYVVYLLLFAARQAINMCV